MSSRPNSTKRIFNLAQLQNNKQLYNGIQHNFARSAGSINHKVGLTNTSTLTNVATVTRNLVAFAETNSINAINFTSFGVNTPRITHRGLLCEHASTNWAPISQSTTAWNTGNMGTINTSSTAGPNGETTFYATLTPSATSQRAQCNITVPNDSTTWTSSLRWIKRGSTQTAQHTIGGAGGTGVGQQLTFNLYSGVISSGVGTIEDKGDHWLTTVTFTNNNTGNTTLYVGAYTDTVGTSPAVVGGLQIENLAYATSYIKTTGSTVTRPADVITQDINIPPYSSYTITGSFKNPPAEVINSNLYPHVFALYNNADPTNRLLLHVTPTNLLYCQSAVNSSTTGVPIAIKASEYVNFAITIKGSQISMSINGAAVSSAFMTNNGMSVPLNKLRIGSNHNGGQHLQSYVKDLQIIPRAYSDVELVAASTLTLLDVNFVKGTYVNASDPFTSWADMSIYYRASSRVNNTIKGTQTTVTSNNPAISNAGFQSDPNSTNLVTASKDFAPAPGSGITVTRNYAVAPDGTTSAARAVWSAISNSYWHDGSYTTTSALLYTASVYIKRNTPGSANMSFRISDGISANFVALNFSQEFEFISTSVAGDGILSQYNIEAVGDGWFRLSITGSFTAGRASTGPFFTTTGAGTGDVLLWGVQFEQINRVTAYIPTTSGALSRSGDGNRIPVYIPPATPFTIICKHVAPPYSPGNFPTIFRIFSNDGYDAMEHHWATGTTSNQLYQSGTSNNGGAYYGAGSNAAIAYGKPGTLLVTAMKVSGTTVTWSVNGSSVMTWTLANGAFTRPLTQILLGSGLTSPVKSCKIENRAYTDAELIAASSTGTLTHDYDFVGGNYTIFGNTHTLSEVNTFTRNSIGYADNSDNTLNTTSYSANTPKISSKGLLIEDSYTNLLLRSQEFDYTGGGTWTPTTYISAVPNTTTAPDGSLTADTLVRSNAINQYMTQNIAKATSALTYTYSVYAKANSANYLAMRIQGSYPARSDAIFNLSSGTITSAATNTAGFTNSLARMSSVGNGWYRCSITTTSDAFSFITMLLSPNSNGTATIDGNDSSATSSVYLWQADLTQTGAPSTRIATTSAAGTVAADILTLNELPVATYSVYAEFIAPVPDATGTLPVWCYDADSTTNRVMLYLDTTHTMQLIVVTAGSTVAQISLGTATPGTTYKVAARLNLNDVAVSIGGAAVQTDTVVTLPAVHTFRIGSSQTPRYLNGYIKNLKRYNRGLSNAELQALTL